MNKIISVVSALIISLFVNNVIANPTNGPIRDRELIRNGDQVQYEFMLNSDEMTVIKVKPLSKNEDVDCYLYDANHSLVDLDEDEGDCSIIINPSYTNGYQLTITAYSTWRHFSTFEINVW